VRAPRASGWPLRGDGRGEARCFGAANQHHRRPGLFEGEAVARRLLPAALALALTALVAWAACRAVAGAVAEVDLTRW
jgi:hypothetical protein